MIQDTTMKHPVMVQAVLQRRTTLGTFLIRVIVETNRGIGEVVLEW